MFGILSPRLCWVPLSGLASLTEASCTTSLRFVGSRTWLRTLHRGGRASRWRPVKARRTTRHTQPPGSQWTMVAEPNTGMRTNTTNLSKVGGWVAEEVM